MKIRRTKRCSDQSGYLLLALVLALALLMVAAVALAPGIAQQIRRDREEELVHRGTQYARAIRRFYKKFGRYPNRLEELEGTNNIRFLRKRYPDPITGSDEWRVIRFGQAKIKPKVFGAAAASMAAGQPAPPGGISGAPPGAMFPGALPGAQGATPGTPGSTTAGAGQGSSSSGSSGGSGLSGQTFGGLPIVGVSSNSDKVSIKEFDGKNHYNEWEFVYDPRYDPSNYQQGGMVQPGAQTTGQPSPLPGFGGPMPGFGNPPPGGGMPQPQPPPKQ